MITSAWAADHPEPKKVALPFDAYHREGWPTTPQTTPPMPFTEWPYGATSSLGVSTPNAVDSPLMLGIAHTKAGE
ncbi:MAG: hypothetical protein NTW94_05360 [Legionellales bacterium]|nr:hypothetical protein [Legionellales bacterium]